MFVNGIDNNFNAFEKLAGMQSMLDRITGQDIYCAIILVDCVTKKLSSDFKNLVGMCTDGAPAMSGKRNRAMALFQEHIGRKVITHHCIIHQQILCSKVLKFDSVISVVVSIVNYPRTKKVKHCLFKSFSVDVDSEYDDVVYYTDVR